MSGTLRYHCLLMKHKVIRRIQRPEPDTVRLLGELGVATVHEAQDRTGLMRPYMRPIYTPARLAAPAVTVLCHPADNLMIHAAVEVCQPGDCLVIRTAGGAGYGDPAAREPALVERDRVEGLSQS